MNLGKGVTSVSLWPNQSVAKPRPRFPKSRVKGEGFDPLYRHPLQRFRFPVSNNWLKIVLGIPNDGGV